MAHDALTSVALVGGGKMGEAIMAGWLQATEGPAAELSPASFQVANPGAERQQYLRDTYGVACVDDASCLSAAQIVVLAVKPQVLPEVLPVVAQLPFLADSLVVSIAAGYTTSRIESFLPEGTHVVRVMPNTPLMVGSGASCLCAGSCATSEELHLAEKLFCSLGKAWVVEESALDAVCAVSGSGPAYVAALIEAMAEGIPTIVTNSGGMIEYVDKETSLVIERENIVENLRRAICHMKESPNVRKQMSAKSKIHSKRYDETGYYMNFVETIYKIMDENGKSRNEN